jgi:hypothetical protein
LLITDNENALSLSQSVKDKRNQYGEVIKRRNRTLLTDKSARRVPGGAGMASLGMTGGQTLEKIPDSSFKKKGEQSADT